MSHIYGYIASEPTRVDCALIRSQRALIRQGFNESRNRPRADGWGAALFVEDEIRISRKLITRPDEPIFDANIADTRARAGIVHVRHGTIGKPDRKNIHPFLHESWGFAHHGTVENFHTLRRELLGELTPEFRRGVEGATDSEHIFFLFLSYLKRSAGSIAGDAPINRIRDSLRKAASMLNEWSERTGTRVQSGLAMMASNRRTLLACSQGGPLFYLERSESVRCPICGTHHREGGEGAAYRAVAVSAEPTSAEDWREVPGGNVLLVDPDLMAEITLIED